jgi:hypothetical protein
MFFIVAYMRCVTYSIVVVCGSLLYVTFDPVTREGMLNSALKIACPEKSMLKKAALNLTLTLAECSKQ